MILPSLPEAPGITWRAPTLDDADALARHTVRIHELDHLEHVPGPDFFRWMMSQDGGIDPADDYRIAVDASGEIVADGGCWAQISDTGARCFLWAEVEQQHHDLQPGLIEWAEARARQRLADRPDGVPAVIRFSVEEHRSRQRAAVKAAGFSTTRSFVIMERDLGDLPDSPRLPDGLRVTPWSPELDDAARICNNEAFADHWGSLPLTAEQWTAILTGTSTFRPEMSFLALDGPRVVAFSLCEVDPEDNATRGVAEMYVNRVATVRGYRRMGLASHLLVRSLEAADKGGLTTAVLEVDENSHTNATEVYRRLDFTVRSRSIHYLKEL
jgi:mycothiol synthase